MKKTQLERIALIKEMTFEEYKNGGDYVFIGR